MIVTTLWNDVVTTSAYADHSQLSAETALFWIVGSVSDSSEH